jgi:catechol 1,2-dioxygenase
MADQQRVATVVADLVNRVRDGLRQHDVTYEEYNAATNWLIRLGEAGEWPLFLDVFFESVVEQMAFDDRPGSKGTIEGPYYVAGAPELDPPYVMPMREGESGDRLVLSGTVRSAADGSPISNAPIDMWQCDAHGIYANIDPSVPEFNLRGKLRTDENGRYEVCTVVPAPYEIPKAGPTGELLAAAGWSAFRPAHLHLKVTAPGHDEITSQLYFENDPYLSTDVASAVKPELILSLDKKTNGPEAKRYGLTEPYFTTGYDFDLPPAA